MTVTCHGTGRVQSGETDCYRTSRLARQNGTERGVLYAHQGTATAAAMWDTVNFAGTAALMKALADAGYVCAGQDLASTTHWGNPTAQARLGATDTWLKTAAPSPGASSSKKRVVVGISMGAAAAVNYFGYDAAATTGHMADLAALVLILPALNLDTYYQGDTGGSRAQIGTAWGVTYPTALPAHADPQTNMTLIAAAAPPVRIYYASDDAIQNAAMAAANLTALGGNGTTISLGALGHTDAAIQAVDKPALVTWLQSVAPV